MSGALTPLGKHGPRETVHLGLGEECGEKQRSSPLSPVNSQPRSTVLFLG